MLGFLFLVYAVLAAVPAVLIYWPFVHKASSRSWKRSLLYAIFCQAASFLTSWTTFLFMAFVLYNRVPAIHDLWKLPEPTLSQHVGCFIAIYQMTVVPVISTVVALLILKKRNLVDGMILWFGHIVVGLIFFASVFLIRRL